MVGDTRTGRLRDELDRLVTSGDAPRSARGDIASSWGRCVLAGLDPGRFEVPYHPDVDHGGRLSWAAAPILDHVATDLEGSGIGLLLTDEHGHVVERRSAERGVLSSLDRIELAPGFVYSEQRVGTNAIGTAIAQHRPSVVTGSEHFADALVRMACTACPISDAAGSVVGVIDLTCTADRFSPLMLAVAKRVAWDIRERFLERAPAGLSGRAAAAAASGWPALTETERAVAGLVAEGMTNREVAQTLLVSPSRVDHRLRGIFRKLGIRSRVELTRVSTLAVSRAQAVAAADDARRRIERDLHDGLQQRLVSLGLEVRQAELSVPLERRQLRTELSHVAEGLMEVLEHVREISRGIHPTILAEYGLAPAIRAIGRRSPVPVRLEVRVDGRLRDAVELAAYYVVSEALANAAKHANAGVVDVVVESVQGSLTVSVRDDGIGGARATGSGLSGLVERVEALGGTMQLVSPPGSGTLIRVALPMLPP
jgi:signal transduction histidine kinase